MVARGGRVWVDVVMGGGYRFSVKWALYVIHIRAYGAGIRGARIHRRPGARARAEFSHHLDQRRRPHFYGRPRENGARSPRKAARRSATLYEQRYCCSSVRRRRYRPVIAVMATLTPYTVAANPITKILGVFLRWVQN